MKKLFALVMAMAMVLSLAACGGSAAPAAPAAPEAVEEAKEAPEAAEEVTAKEAGGEEA